MKVQSSWHPDSREQESHASARSLLKAQQGDSGMHQAVLFFLAWNGSCISSFPLVLEPSCPVCLSSYFYLPPLPSTGLIFSMLYSFISPFLSVPILVSSQFQKALAKVPNQCSIFTPCGLPANFSTSNQALLEILSSLGLEDSFNDSSHPTLITLCTCSNGEHLLPFWFSPFMGLSVPFSSTQRQSRK